MADPSKSSQTAKNVVIALLALWSIISLVVIVVWSTSPDMKSAAQCRTELQDTTEKLEGVKVVCKKNKVALEEQVEAEREEQLKQKAEILVLLGHLNATNHTLEECRQENLILQTNVSVLQENIEQLRLTEANLTAQISLQQDQIDAMEQNLTQAAHQTEACASLRAAAESQMLAAQSQTRACESGQQYMKKQLLKCKLEESEAPEQSQQVPPAPTPSSDASPLSGIPALMLLVCSALRLIT
ncbi:coiled-coil domain-containing protein 18 [Notolabrus celidotus]|uniref:coiled-coil domain-containing protein 18 n=1 Tax=Notolabrus celidotus TaxID=1203425 RepID=UPI0014901861|nr:coiled-coil domain-containing protein 18 [Notolabrus celidotus]